MELRSQRRRKVVCARYNWGELPQELLDLIAQHLTTAQDFCRFGAVCTSWHKAAVQPNYTLNGNRQVPWFMVLLAVDPMRRSTRRTKHIQSRFYDPCTGRSCKLNLPALNSHMYIVGSCHGWVAIHELQTNKVRLLNPLTSAEIHLPPFTSSGGLVRVSLSGSPSKGNFMALLYHAGILWQVIARVGAAPCDQWTRICAVDEGELYHLARFRDHFYALILKESKLVVVKDTNKLDESPLTLFTGGVALPVGFRFLYDLSVIPRFIRAYLVPGMDELLVCVIHLQPIPIDATKGPHFWKWRVFRVQMKKDESGMEEAELEVMESLGDGAVFISDRSSLHVSKLPLHDAGCKYKRNSIYFHSSFLFAGAESIIWESSLERGVTEPFHRYGTTSESTNVSCDWVVPNLW